MTDSTNVEFETTRDFESIIRCLTINPEGIGFLSKDKAYIELVNSFFPYLQPAKKRPDAYSIQGDSVLILEHFEFDNSKTTRKGSEQNRIEAKTQRVLDSKSDFLSPAMIQERVEKTGAYYIQNLERVFSSHASSIEDYKKEINFETGRSFNNYIVGFVIEDASSFGSEYYDWGENVRTQASILYAKEFLDLFDRTPQLDFVIFSFTKSSYQNNDIFFISHNTIKDYRKKEIEVSKIPHFLFEDSLCMTVPILLPIKKK